MRETENDALMKRVDKEGDVLGFSVLNVTELKKGKPLLAALKKAPRRSRLKARIIQALSSHYSRGEAEIKELIDQDIVLVISALESGRATESFGPSFYAVGLLRISAEAEAREALERAAQSHPNTRIRSYA